MSNSELEAQYIKARKAHGILCPAVAPRTFKPYIVTLAWRVSNAVAHEHWAAGHHTGEDHACPTGSLAVSVAHGTVIGVGWSALGWGQSYGYMVIVRKWSLFPSKRYNFAYCHLSKTLVKVGTKVKPGTILGLTGESGNVSGPHLHFEVRPNGGRYGSDVNPMLVKRR